MKAIFPAWPALWLVAVLLPCLATAETERHETAVYEFADGRVRCVVGKTSGNAAALADAHGAEEIEKTAQVLTEIVKDLRTMRGL